MAREINGNAADHDATGKKNNRKHPPETDTIICFGWRARRLDRTIWLKQHEN